MKIKKNKIVSALASWHKKNDKRHVFELLAKVLSSDNKNKSTFILYCAHLIVPLQP